MSSLLPPGSPRQLFINEGFGDSYKRAFMFCHALFSRGCIKIIAEILSQKKNNGPAGEDRTHDVYHMGY
jgi:hypothetical protein